MDLLCPMDIRCATSIYPPSNELLTNLPAPLTTFIGPEKEQSGVINLLHKHRLVTLTGSGGIGKTRLSLKVGEQVAGNYANGVWLVELAPILDPLLVPRVPLRLRSTCGMNHSDPSLICCVTTSAKRR